MSSPGVVRRSIVLAVLAVALSSSSARSFTLQCQMRATASGYQAPVEVSFHPLADGGVLPHAFHWDFGDGASSDESDPIHTFTENTFYRVVMTVTDSDFPPQTCSDTLNLSPGTIVDPFCGQFASTRWGEVPLMVQFTAYPGLIGDPEPYSWTWTFGDGEVGVGQVVNHPYDSPGTRWAKATLHTPYASYPCYGTLRVSALPAEVADVEPASAPALRLAAPVPNPFRTITAIGYEVPSAGRVRLRILDAGGRRVATLVDGLRPSGRHYEAWQGRAEGGSRVRPGVYFVSLEQGGSARQIKLVRID